MRERLGGRRLRAVAFAAGTVVLASLVTAAPAAADDDCAPWCAGIGGPGQGGGGEDAPAPIGGSPGYAWYDFGLDRDDDDNLCWYPEFLGYQPTPPPEDQTWAYVNGRIVEWTSDDIGPTRCPGTEDAFDPGEFARSFWLSADPVASSVTIDPGEALAGLRTYLVLEGPTSITLGDDTPLGRLTISGRVSYEIDWGDGTVTTSEHQGVPYPGGATEITHVYTDVGTYTVTVTSVWSGSWTAGALSGDLPVLHRDASTTLPVTERQAVRVD